MFEHLPGFRDFYPEDCARRNYLFNTFRKTARLHGFHEYDVPILEPLELYIEKSGEEIVSQLFNFVDKGDRAVSLRPELTPSLARLVGSKANALKRPVKWFAVGENFRYEKPQKGRLRSHYQWNCDIFGELGPGADAELIATCLSALINFGLKASDVVLRLSDRQFWIAYLQGRGLDESKALDVLSVIDKMEREPEEVSLKKLADFVSADVAVFWADIQRLVGIRDLTELKAFVKNKVSETKILEQIEARLTEFDDLLNRIDAFGLSDFVRLDLGIVRGLAYYTGFVFEVFELSDEGTQGRAVAGGGRYDHLIKKLGYTDMPAAGFGMGDVVLADVLASRHLLPEMIQKPDVYMVIGTDEARTLSLGDVGRLRSAGYSVEYPLKRVAFGKQFKLANQSGARYALIYGEDELASGAVKIRNMVTGEETSYPQDHLLEALQSENSKG